MSCKSKIRNCMTYTDTEQRLCEYILQHPQEVIYDTAQSFSMKTNASPAAVIRFSKKLGYKGFTELKVDLAQDDDFRSEDTFAEQIKQNDSLKDIIEKAKSSDRSTVEDTYQLLHLQDLEQAVEILKRAKRIWLLGIGASGVCCMDFMQKLTRIGKDVVFHSDFHTQLSAMAHIAAQDAVLAISYGGNTREINTALQYAKEQNCDVLGITQLSKNPMQKLCDHLLYVPALENDLRLGAVSSRNASLILTDLLYLGMICDDLDQYKEELKISRNLVKEL